MKDFLKRVSIGVLGRTQPLFILIAIAVKLTSKAPCFKTGKNGYDEKLFK